MKKIICGIVIALFLFGTVWIVSARSGRESTQLPPQEVEIMYPSEDHAYKVKDINDVIRYKVFPDGGPAVFNASGATVWGIEGATGKPAILPKEKYAYVSFRGRGAGAELSAVTHAYTTSGASSLYLMDLTNSYGQGTGNILPSPATGVSVYLPAGTAALDGATMNFKTLNTSGATMICLVPANDAKRASGVTDHILNPSYASHTNYGIPTSGATYSTGTFDAYMPVAAAPGTFISIMYRYVNSSGGTWYVLSGSTPWN